jgi:hypothetical protein
MEKLFLDTLAALGPARDHLVLVGGWCPFLYARYLWRRTLPALPTTLDIDLGVTETGPERFAPTVFDRLRREGYAVERLYPDEAEPVEFVHKHGRIELKLEFITSFLTSDDTLNRFLGRSLACNRLEAFELLLQDPLPLEIPHAHRRLRVRVPRPATFLFHKGISFVMRSEPAKRDKDLFYVYFLLRHHPDRPALLDELASFKGQEWFGTFRKNLQEHLGDPDRPGYAVLRRFLGAEADPRSLDREIREDVAGLLAVLEGKPRRT